MSSVSDITYEAMDSAVDGGRYAEPLTPGDVECATADLMDCCSDLEDANPAEVERAVTSWARRRDLFAPDRVHPRWSFRVGETFEVVTVRALDMLAAQDRARAIAPNVHLTFVEVRTPQ